jgi:NAD(P)H-dependent FMN reductase
MDNKELKNFDSFLSENWDNTERQITEFKDEITTSEEAPTATDNIEENSDELPNTLKAFGDELETEDTTDTDFESSQQISLGTPLSALPTKSEMKIVILNGVVASSSSTQNPASSLSATIQDKIGATDTKEIKLFQLNIQPLNDGTDEPLDGMELVYQTLEGADAVIVVSNIKKGQISSVLQTAMERIGNYYKQKELRNVVFGSIVAGEEDAHQNVKASLLNFANNMGMIVGGDCNVFCCAEEGDSCDHQYESDTTCAATCIKELCNATKAIRSTITPQSSKDGATALLSITDTIKTFDEFEKGMDAAPVDKGLETETDFEEETEGEAGMEDAQEIELTDTDTDTETETDAEIEAAVDDVIQRIKPEAEVREIEDKDSTEMGGQLATFSEEEETAYDYMNNIVYNQTETPMTKPNRDIAEKLPKIEKEKKEAEEEECCETENTNESILDFNDFLGKQI